MSTRFGSRTVPSSFSAARDWNGKTKDRTKSFLESPFRKEKTMAPKKTLQQREAELQSLLATPAGQEEVHELASRYLEASDRLRPARTSVITYLLVHERDRGLISG